MGVPDTAGAEEESDQETEEGFNEEAVALKLGPDGRAPAVGQWVNHTEEGAGPS